MEDKNNPWILERTVTISKTESLNASITTNMAI